VEPVDIGTHGATLDDVFMTLTGQVTTEPVDDVAPAAAGPSTAGGRR
jgi:hypothetical protein